MKIEFVVRIFSIKTTIQFVLFSDGQLFFWNHHYLWNLIDSHSDYGACNFIGIEFVAFQREFVVTAFEDVDSLQLYPQQVQLLYVFRSKIVKTFEHFITDMNRLIFRVHAQEFELFFCSITILKKPSVGCSIRFDKIDDSSEFPHLLFIV